LAADWRNYTAIDGLAYWANSTSGMYKAS